jgi:hypothetical protein
MNFGKPTKVSVLVSMNFFNPNIGLDNEDLYMLEAHSPEIYKRNIHKLYNQCINDFYTNLSKDFEVLEILKIFSGEYGITAEITFKDETSCNLFKLLDMTGTTYWFDVDHALLIE